MLDEGPGMPAPNQRRQVLDACAGCFRQKLSCQTSGAGGQKKIAKELEESGMDDRECWEWEAVDEEFYNDEGGAS